MLRYTLTVAVALVVFGLSGIVQSQGFAAGARFEITIEAGKHDRTNSPVKASIRVPAALRDATFAKLTSDAKLPAVGQVTAPSLLAKAEPGADGTVARELQFVLPSLKAGETLKLTAEVSAEAPSSKEQVARIQDTPGEYTELMFGDRPVLRYMYKKLDESSKEAREQTYKVYHHAYNPSGKEIITKGPGGQYTHHRGLYFGFNRVTYGDGKKADVWHCTGDAHQSHEGFTGSETGPVLGRHTLNVAWHGEKKEVFANEQRELTIYNLPGGTLIDFASRVRSDGPVRLDGDPQHAGFHFRASQEVAEKNAKQTYYLRPDGPGKPGETRNWNPKDKSGPVNLPWNAMSFVVSGKRYTVANFDRPQNPKEARFSERDYGRFGSYFEYDLTPDRPLEINYRIWLQNGETTGERVAAMAADFAEPVTVKVSSGS